VIPLLDIYPTEHKTEYNRDTCIHHSTIHNSHVLEPTQVPTTDEWIKKIWYMYTVEYYSAIRNNDMWFEGKWMQLENITLSELSRIRNTKATSFLSYVEERSKDKHIHKNKHDHIQTQV
jgi:hypothetical protein